MTQPLGPASTGTIAPPETDNKAMRVSLYGKALSLADTPIAIHPFPGIDTIFPQAGAGEMFDFLCGYNGANWDRLRTPTVFKHGLITAAGNTTIWTPTSGKKFRLMRFAVGIGGSATLGAAGVETITFTDSGTGIPGVRFDVQVSNAAVTGEEFWSGWIDWANGVLSAAANNPLQVNLGTAFTAGGATVMVAGCEE